MFTLRSVWVLSVLFLTLACVGCDSDTSSSTSSADEAPAPTGSTTVADPAAEAGCTAANEVCFTIQIPADMEGAPEAIIVGLYNALPPMGPPTVFPPFQIDVPEVTAGEPLDVKMVVEQTGTFQAYTVLYMPNGGLAQWLPLAGVDFANSSEAFELTGEAYTHPTDIVLEMAAE